MQLHVGREREIAGHFFPDEMKFVVGGPHVPAAARDEIFTFGGIKIRRAVFGNLADVRLIGKNSQRR